MAYKLAVIGATGAVGREILKILAERNFPIAKLRLFASARSAGKELDGVVVEDAATADFPASTSCCSRLAGRPRASWRPRLLLPAPS